MRTLLFLSALFLSACATGPLSADLQKQVDNVAVVSLLGDRLQARVIGTTIFQNREDGFDISAWKFNQGTEKLFIEGFRAKGKKAFSLNPPKAGLDSALRAQADGMKSFLGTHNNEMFELLAKTAEEKGAPYFLWIGGTARHDNFPHHAGPLGVICYRSLLRNSPPTPYFLGVAVLYDTKTRKVVYRRSLDPGDTAERTYSDCAAVEKMGEKEYLAAARGPVEAARKFLVDQVLANMGL